MRRELGEGLPERMRQSVAELFFANLLTCTLYGAVWTFQRRRELDALAPPPPLRIPVAWAVVVALEPVLTGFARYSSTALAAILGSASIWATLAFNYRFLWNLRWRAERFGLPFEVGVIGWLGWFCFGRLYVQHKINQLVRLEQRLVRELAERAPPDPVTAMTGEGAEKEAGGATDETKASDATIAARAPRRLKNKAFWDLVDLIDHEALRRGDDVAAVMPLRASLATAPIALRCAFHETLAQKLYAFDGPMFAAAAGTPSGDEDRGLLARAFVVAGGQVRYREVLATPEEMPKESVEQCAALLEVAKDATADAGEGPFDFVPSVGLATGSNVAFWASAGSAPAEAPAEDEPRRLA